MAGFFPIFSKDYWSGDVEDTVSTFRLEMANSLSGLVVVLLAPLLGAIADQGGTRRHFLLLFTVMGSAMTACLHLVQQGAWELAIFVYAAATLSFSMANTFYDSLLSDVAPRTGRRYFKSGVRSGLSGWRTHLFPPPLCCDPSRHLWACQSL